MAGIVGSIGAGAVVAFGIDVSRIHWDMTSISLFSAYEETEEDFAEPRSSRLRAALGRPTDDQKVRADPFAAEERWVIARRLLHDRDLDLVDRVAGSFVHAQTPRRSAASP